MLNTYRIKASIDFESLPDTEIKASNPGIAIKRLLDRSGQTRDGRYNAPLTVKSGQTIRIQIERL